MVVNFTTPTKISLMDMTSMGDSIKKGNEKTIGTFDSGFKYSIALCLRNNIKLKVSTYEAEGLEETYTFDSKVIECEDTGKKKELITVTTSIKPKEIVTGFAKALGHNWELWMLLREVWSNMLDEGGMISDKGIHAGTVVSLEFDENSEFYNIWENKHLYINQEAPLFKISDSVEALRNEEGFLRIYKQNILVYSDENKSSKYSYNIKFGEIDERRILSNLWSIENSIASAIRFTSNKEFLEDIITKSPSFKDGEFLTGQTIYGDASDLSHEVAASVFDKHGEVSSYTWLIDAIKRRKDCKIGGKILKSVEDSIWTYSSQTEVETVPQTYSEPDIEVEEVVYESSFSAEIKKKYNFKLDVEVKKAKLKGSKVIADKFEKCIIIDDDFDLNTDFGAFIIEYIDLTKEGNAVKNLGEFIVEILRVK